MLPRSHNFDDNQLHFCKVTNEPCTADGYESTRFIFSGENLNNQSITIHSYLIFKIDSLAVTLGTEKLINWLMTNGVVATLDDYFCGAKERGLSPLEVDVVESFVNRCGSCEIELNSLESELTTSLILMLKTQIFTEHIASAGTDYVYSSNEGYPEITEFTQDLKSGFKLLDPLTKEILSKAKLSAKVTNEGDISLIINLSECEFDVLTSNCDFVAEKKKYLQSL